MTPSFARTRGWMLFFLLLTLMLALASSPRATAGADNSASASIPYTLPDREPGRAFAAPSETPPLPTLEPPAPPTETIEPPKETPVPEPPPDTPTLPPPSPLPTDTPLPPPPDTATPRPSDTPTVTLPPPDTPTALPPTPTPTNEARPTATPTLAPTPTATPILLPTLTPTLTPTPTPTSRPLSSLVRLNEFLPRPLSDWNGDGTANTGDEYIELLNLSDQPVDLTGLQLDDAAGGTAPHTLSGTLPAGAIAVFFRSETGVALNDTGDDVRLLAPDGTPLDTYTYPSAAQDQAWSRDDLGTWHADWPPSPGLPNQPPPTPTPTASPTPLPAGLTLNEFMPRPVSDWNGDGTADADDEYIEIINRSSQPFDLTGLQLDDAAGGSTPHVLTGTLAVGGIAVFYRSETGIALNDTGGDEARLLAPDGSVLDAQAYTTIAQDQAWSRDDLGTWHTDWPPSPGLPNQPPPTPTPTLSPTPLPAGLTLNEFMPRPLSDWNGDGTADADDEYIEIINRSSQPFDLTGLQLDDTAGGSTPHVLTGTLPAGGIAVFYRSETGIALNDTGGDEARLLAPDGTLLDAQAYTTIAQDQSWSRDKAGVWHTDWPPSPGLPNQPPPTPTPTLSPTPLPAGLSLNEFMPRPLSDWNGDGIADADDEYIEIINRSSQPFDLTGLQLDDTEGGSAPHVLTGTLPAGGIAVFYRSETGIALNDTGGDEARLLAPDGTVLNAQAYSTIAQDQSWSRDDAGAWHTDWPPSPGLPNQPPPTPTPTLSPTPLPKGLWLNEFIPRPLSDWNGDGTANADDEYIEIINRSSQPFDLMGLQLDDAAGGSAPHVLTGTLPAGGIAVFYRNETGIALNDTGGDEARLLAPDGTVLDAQAYTTIAQDQSWSRDKAGAWHTDWPPSPGLPNQPPPTPTPTLSPTPLPTGLWLNEFMPRPLSDWNGDGTANADDEYIEIINRSSQPFDLTGLQLDDIEGGSAPHGLTGTLAAGGIAVFYRSETGIALNDSGGDEARLLAPDGTLLDAQAYTTITQDQSWSRDDAGVWHTDWPPSPGLPNQPAPPPTPTPRPGALVPLLISEVVYDGTIAGQGDEFAEIWNPTDGPVALAGWGIGDETTAGGNESLYRFPALALEPGATLVIARQADAFFARYGRWPDFAFRASSSENPVPLLARDTAWGSGHWALTDDGDEVLLLDPWNRRVDRLAFRNSDFAALGLTGHDISAPAPRALHPVDTLRTTNLNDWLAYDAPTPGTPYLIPDAPAAPLGPDVGGLRVAWGSFHSHSSYSDGSGPPELAFAVARANGLNFMGLTDHSHWYNQPERSRTFAAAQAANQPGAFLALVGFEWTHRTEGHSNVFLTVDDASRERADGATLADFYNWLAARPQALATFNHPFPGEFNDLARVPAVAGQFVGLEVANGSGSAFRRYEDSYWLALHQGWRVGAMGNLDTESATWGDDGPLRTGVLLPALTESALLDALRARRTFATEDANLALALRAGNTWMGGEVSAGSLTLSVLASDANGEAARLELLRDGLVVATAERTLGAAPLTWEVAVDALAGDIYVARLVQGDGQQAWSSPLWVAGSAQPLAPQLTEVLTAPRDVDWDGDGEATFRDEWIELHNPHDRPLSLAGWRLEKETFGYTFPLGARIEPGQYLVMYQRETELSLSNFGETIWLRRPDGSQADKVDVDFQGYDRSKSFCAGGWEERMAPSPGAPCPWDEEEEEEPGAGGAGSPTSGPRGGDSAQPIAQVRLLPDDSRVTVEGVVTAAPGTFNEAVMYIQDESGGIKIYRNGGLEPFALGERVRVAGYLHLAFGEWEISVPKSWEIERLGLGTPLLPRPIEPGEMSNHPGELVQVTGRVEGWSGPHWYLDDGEESLFIYHDSDTGVQRPYLQRGELRSVVGIVGWSDYGPRLMPRNAQDLEPDALGGVGDAGPPRLLPVTGRE